MGGLFDALQNTMDPQNNSMNGFRGFSRPMINPNSGNITQPPPSLFGGIAPSGNTGPQPTSNEPQPSIPPQISPRTPVIPPPPPQINKTMPLVSPTQYMQPANSTPVQAPMNKPSGGVGAAPGGAGGGAIGQMGQGMKQLASMIGGQKQPGQTQFGSGFKPMQGQLPQSMQNSFRSFYDTEAGQGVAKSTGLVDNPTYQGWNPSEIENLADTGSVPLSGNPQQRVAESFRMAQAGGSPWELANKWLGSTETANSKVLGDYFKQNGMNLNPRSTPWCAAFANAVLGEAGIKGTGQLNARSFMKWGEPTTTPKRGDIAVFSRGDPKGPFGHVGFYAGTDKNGNIMVLGGNQGDSVSIKSYPQDRLLGYRTAPTAENIQAQARNPVDVNPNNFPKNSDPRLGATMMSISQIESSHNYGELSKPSKGGDRAYGRYQIMGKNIPSWTKEALGKSMTPDEFIKNPDAQDKTAAYHINQNITQYGSPQQAASVWFTGRPINERSAAAKDVYGTSGKQYVNTFNKYYSNYATPSSAVKPPTAIPPPAPKVMPANITGPANMANIPPPAMLDIGGFDPSSAVQAPPIQFKAPPVMGPGGVGTMPNIGGGGPGAPGIGSGPGNSLPTSNIAPPTQAPHIQDINAPDLDMGGGGGDIGADIGGLFSGMDVQMPDIEMPEIDMDIDMSGFDFGGF